MAGFRCYRVLFALLLLTAKLRKVCPCVEPGVMAVVEGDSHRVITHGLQILDFNIALARDGHPLLR